MNGSSLPLHTIAITWVKGRPKGRVTKADTIFGDEYISNLAGSQLSLAYKIEDIYGRDGRRKDSRIDSEDASSSGH